MSAVASLLGGRREKRNSEKPSKDDRKEKGDDKKRSSSLSSSKEVQKEASAKETKEPGVAVVVTSAAAAPASDSKGGDEKKRKGTEPDVNKYVGEIPPLPPATFTHKYEDLPAEIRKVLDAKEMKMDRALMDKYINHLWTVSRFLMRDSFPPSETAAAAAGGSAPKSGSPATGAKDEKKTDKKDDGHRQRRTEARVRPYALDEQIEAAKTLVVVADKPMKKLYKGNEHAGHGGFGEVFVAKDLNSKGGKERVAIKRVKHDTARVQENNFTEIAFLALSKQPNIVDFKKAFIVKEDKKNPDEVWIVMEYLEGGTLGEAAAANALSEDHIAFVAHEILAALKYLHERQWAHRDLKSANVMMSIKGEIKLIDFGLCADFSEGPRTQMLGSPYWIPPEMIYGHPHSYPVDVWSMGVCLVELLLTHPPNNENNIKAMFLVASKGLNDTFPSYLGAQGRAFLSRCLVLDQEKRPPVAELLKDPWVSRPNLNKGIEEVLKQVFLSASFTNLGF